MPYNPYSPYPQNPYGQPMYGFAQPNQYVPQQPQPPQYPIQENVYAFVNGVEGAKSFQVRPNQSIMLMDSEQPMCYMKQADAMGKATVRYFKLTEIPEDEAKAPTPKANNVEFVTKRDFDALAKRVEELSRSNKRPQQNQPKEE